MRFQAIAVIIKRRFMLYYLEFIKFYHACTNTYTANMPSTNVKKGVWQNGCIEVIISLKKINIDT